MPGATLLGVFAKHCVPGRVKTRLAATVGDAVAAEIAERFLRAILERFANTADRRVLAYAPDDAGQPMASLAGRRWSAEPQGDGDLGRRMRRFFERSFAAGAERVVLLGSDSPNLPPSIVEAALAQLTEDDVVLGPSVDGGYYLIGARREPPPLFDGMPWSTPELWAATTARLADAGIAHRPLPVWYDVDTIEELRRLYRELAAEPELSTPLTELAARLDALLGEP
ncbi:MAG: TIGR04282 family arsenosugar biosynthesis glycosyltransferase [Planctomycetota bacterium]